MQADLATAPAVFGSLSEWIEAHGSKRKFVAQRLGISVFQLRGLLMEDGQRPTPEIFDVRSDLAARVGALIGQTADDVREFYRRSAAA